MKINRINFLSGLLLLALAVSSCIKNDLPYPYIVGEISEMEVLGQTATAKIDPNSRTVELTVGEDALIDSIVVSKFVANTESKIIPDSNRCHDILKYPDFSFTSLAELPSVANTVIDFTNPVTFLLRTYQDYYWKISVNQQIERIISVEHQVGKPVIDVKNRIAIVYVDTDQSLTDITIKEMKLEGSKSVFIPDPATVHDFSRPQYFKAYRGTHYMGEWIVDVLTTELISSQGEVEVWAKKAIVNGGIKQGKKAVIEYRKETDTEWNTLSEEAVTYPTNTTFKATISGLDDDVTYAWRIVVDGVAGSESTFTTEKIVEIPNLNFDTWTQKGKNWYANSVADNYDNPQAFWGTGNEGVTSTLAGGHDPITVPVDGSEAYKGRAAKMQSITGVTLVGAAAGNLFIGKYKTNMGTPSASVTFGRPYTGARPTRMEGYYKYQSKPINHGSYPGNLVNDECHIYLKLWDATGSMFGYGEFIGTESVDTYQKFSFDIVYTDLKAKPASITIVATSSHYGGEFDGAKVKGQVGNGSTLWVDEFELFYE